jgi:hypothetical protein
MHIYVIKHNKYIYIKQRQYIQNFNCNKPIWLQITHKQLYGDPTPDTK